MNSAELEKKLISAARSVPLSEVAPFAFEKRIMARLASLAVPDRWALWSRALWRAAVPCVAIVMVLSAWVFFSEFRTGLQENLDTVIENTVLAAIDHPGDSW